MFYYPISLENIYMQSNKKKNVNTKTVLVGNAKFRLNLLNKKMYFIYLQKKISHFSHRRIYVPVLYLIDI